MSASRYGVGYGSRTLLKTPSFMRLGEKFKNPNRRAIGGARKVNNRWGRLRHNMERRTTQNTHSVRRRTEHRSPLIQCTETERYPQHGPGLLPSVISRARDYVRVLRPAPPGAFLYSAASNTEQRTCWLHRSRTHRAIISQRQAGRLSHSHRQNYRNHTSPPSSFNHRFPGQHGSVHTALKN